MPVAAVSEGEIQYEESGSGSPLMLISGLGGVGRFWHEQVAAFSPRFRVVTHDHRGTGRSTKSRIRYSIAQMAQDVLAVMDAARVSRAALVGHSTGGAIAQYLAAHHADRVERLVLSATWAFADVYFRELFQTRQLVLRNAGFAAYDRWGKLLCYPPWFITLHPEALKPAAGDPMPEVVSSRIDALLEFDSRHYLRRINAPVLIVGADDDMVTPPHLSDTLLELCPRARRVRLERGGHYCPQTMAAEYNAALECFLSAP